jgi:hypothetical protein
MTDNFEKEFKENIANYTQQQNNTEEVVEEVVEQKETEENTAQEETEIEKQSQNEVNLDKELSGLPKDLVAIVKTMQNPDDRAKAIKLAKEQRAREDRLHLENGNLKKERDNVSNLLKNLETNPAETIKHLAKELNFDLTSLNEPVYDDNNYLSPEELSKKQIQDIEKKSKQSIQEEINQREANELLEELFSIDEYNQDFIFENQPAFIQYYNQELQKNGVKQYYSKKSRLEAMKVAANKINRLDPDYDTKIEAKIRQQIDNEKKSKFDEAKKQQKISKPLNNSDKILTWEEQLKEDVKQYIKHKQQI